ncbi:hypothetical protein BK767_01865 [Bacillus thuringiensis serovar kyushuensis]|uniref:hypothetical protein n=1 Tax=Bacillus thuringiensis TaxID=1428 RepID=UPI000B4423D5|nr:hypothetical protein [Bacillus thuringiensis]MEC2866938.1 hypothetical protein [Bacillus cereus]OTZ79491.1 hypothetical protein BK767_01865 [Bacillus thuringiensis serovar kyushuensis]OTZ79995.1 hypothetical protein BK768_05895 [Bacillus thuringiensis serovar tohokuensis]
MKNGGNSYLIRSNMSGKLAVIENGSKNNAALIVQYDQQSVGNGEWEFHPVESFTMPTLPELKPQPSSPVYSESGGEGQAMPDTSEKAVVAATLFPAVMVRNNSWSLSTQMRYSPYYILEKQQYWKKVVNLSFAPGESKTTTYKYGMRETDQTTMHNTISMTVGMDSGVNIEGVTESMKGEITNSLEITESHTTELMKDYDETITISNPFQKQSMQYAKYILTTEFVLKRTDGSVADSWSMTDNNTVHTTSYPRMSEDTRFTIESQSNSQSCNNSKPCK